jgi:hypothetical protein
MDLYDVEPELKPFKKNKRKKPKSQEVSSVELLSPSVASNRREKRIELKSPKTGISRLIR